MPPPNVLVLSRNYPNSLIPSLGTWVQHLVRHTIRHCQLRVVAPTPYCPPLPGMIRYTRFRAVERFRTEGSVAVYHPRFLAGPGQWLNSLEALGYFLGIRRLVDRIRDEFPFGLIHAHFSYPDGVVATWLGRRYGVPVVVTEHALWRPWMERCHRVRKQTLAAAREFALHIGVSTAMRDQIAHFTGHSPRQRVIPIGVDGTLFSLGLEEARDPWQILYVGRIHPTKGVDILLRALCLLARRYPQTRLVLAGSNLYGGTEEAQMHRLSRALGIERHVSFLGYRPLPEVAELMRSSAVLVLPSRRESFGAVLVEALACGTPVVATRCGGPEDILTPEVGRLVPVGDPDALAGGIANVLESRGQYDANRLRAHALGRFSWERVAAATMQVYQEALDLSLAGDPRATAQAAPHGVTFASR